ncbi:MAG: YciI family protein [Phycisphaerales bacterium]
MHDTLIGLGTLIGWVGAGRPKKGAVGGALMLASALLLASCASTAPGPSAANDEYVLVTLRSGPDPTGRSDADRAAIQAAHLANIRRLAEEHKLLVAGPYGKVNHDPTARGIFILNVRSFDEARAITKTDPAVIDGVLAMDLESLRTDADLRAALDAELAVNAEVKRAGGERPMGEGMRTYIVLRADDGAQAARALDRILPPNTIVVGGRVDGTRGFFILDATDPSTVRGWIAKEPDALGPCTLDEWYGSALLVRAMR